MTAKRSYLRRMPADPDLKRLAWRAHHRGTKEADLLIGGFFDAHHESWNMAERTTFAAMLDEQDVDIMAWAHGTAEVPGRYDGPMIQALKRLEYIQVAK